MSMKAPESTLNTGTLSTYIFFGHLDLINWYILVRNRRDLLVLAQVQLLRTNSKSSSIICHLATSNLCGQPFALIYVTYRHRCLYLTKLGTKADVVYSGLDAQLHIRFSYRSSHEALQT